MKQIQSPDEQYADWQRRLYEIIFEAETPAGKLFDVILLILILLSVVGICLESLLPESGDGAGGPARIEMYRTIVYAGEWLITILFTLEYFARILCVRKPLRYIFSFFGIVDLLAILPTYVATVAGGTGASLTVVRAIRLIRVFRVMKLVWLLTEANEMSRAIWKARGKIIVFLAVVLIAVTIFGAAMYELEPDTFQSIPQAMYWAIVTMTTVGYGDIVPVTPIGKFLSSLLILLGYSLIIVPTGFVTAEFFQSISQKSVTTRVCGDCLSEGHDRDAKYCKYCGETFEGN